MAHETHVDDERQCPETYRRGAEKSCSKGSKEIGGATDEGG
jgi:hypothetical protein